jgi:ABC-type glycerol-3-phosphate transport system permease component
MARPIPQPSGAGVGRTVLLLGVGRLLLYLVMTLIALVWMLPFIWMLKTSFSPGVNIFSTTLQLIPDRLTLDNFAAVFRIVPLRRMATNSAIIAIGTTIVVIVTSSLAGYALSRPGLPGATFLLFFFLAALMIPGESLLIPSFIGVKNLGLLDSYWGVILPMAVDAFVIFIFARFFAQIPQEIIDAAVIDGASDFAIFTRIVVPISAPVFAAMTILVFVGAYDAFLWPLVVLNDRGMMPLTLGLFYFESEQIRNYENVIAYSCLLMLPVLVLFLFCQRFFIKGLQLGAVKG